MMGVRDQHEHRLGRLLCDLGQLSTCCVTLASSPPFPGRQAPVQYKGLRRLNAMISKIEDSKV